MSVLDLDFSALCERHESLLFDAYGVLVHSDGVIDGAVDAIDSLLRRGQRFVVLTNDASRSPKSSSDRFKRLGLQIEPHSVLSSGGMVQSYFASNGLEGARCAVLGTRDSRWFVSQAGGEVLERCTDPADVVVICDEQGFDFIPTLDAMLSWISRVCEQGRPPVLLLPNPDLIYPAAEGGFGFTAGSVAAMLEAGLFARLGPTAPRFVALGKPSTFLFEHAIETLGTRDCVMLGDQLATDILGANSARISSALLLTGVTRREHLTDSAIQPSYVLESLQIA
ncbi:MAG: HAD-IA family hydrolase [Deltaproteobacteria bacterium]|nr:HAD-IA family hydrolase [Deltaproteobacteria bacterium]